MSRKWIIALIAVGVSMSSYFAARFVWYGFLQGVGCFTFHSEWSSTGKRQSLEGVNIWGQRFLDCYYWGPDGHLDLERTGWFDSDERIRPLSTAELEALTPERIVWADIEAILFAESIVHCRSGQCATDADLFENPAWWDATGKRNPRPLDPWGRSYEITLTHGGAGVVVGCRGRDGVEGGTGGDADHQASWDISMGHKGGERW